MQYLEHFVSLMPSLQNFICLLLDSIEQMEVGREVINCCAKTDLCLPDSWSRVNFEYVSAQTSIESITVQRSPVSGPALLFSSTTAANQSHTQPRPPSITPDRSMEGVQNAEIIQSYFTYKLFSARKVKKFNKAEVISCGDVETSVGHAGTVYIGFICVSWPDSNHFIPQDTANNKTSMRTMHTSSVISRQKSIILYMIS